MPCTFYCCRRRFLFCVFSQDECLSHRGFRLSSRHYVAGCVDVVYVLRGSPRVPGSAYIPLRLMLCVIPVVLLFQAAGLVLHCFVCLFVSRTKSCCSLVPTGGCETPFTVGHFVCRVHTIPFFCRRLFFAVQTGQIFRDFEQAALPRDVRPPPQEGRSEGGHDLPPPPAGKNSEAPAGAHPHPAQEDARYIPVPQCSITRAGHPALG